MQDRLEQGSLRDLLSVRGLADDAPLLAEAIVDTVEDCILLLDPQLKVILANRSFYMTFRVEPAATLEWMVYELGNGQWNIPELRKLLEDVLPGNSEFSGYEVTHMFPGLGRKVMRLNGRKLRRREGQTDLILLAIQDVTALHDREAELRRLAKEREALVQEIHHRVKNNLQTIAALLSLHSEYSDKSDVIAALGEAQGRVQAIAQLHERLYSSASLSEVNIGDYLRSLAATLQTLHGRPEIAFDIDVADLVVGSGQAMPLALIANELILNCFKHAFPSGSAGHVTLSLRYARDTVPSGGTLDAGEAELEVRDNGAGFPPGVHAETHSSMGLELVRLLCRQLRAQCKCEPAAGVRWTVRFPLTPLQDA